MYTTNENTSIIILLINSSPQNNILDMPDDFNICNLLYIDNCDNIAITKYIITKPVFTGIGPASLLLKPIVVGIIELPKYAIWNTIW